MKLNVCLSNTNNRNMQQWLVLPTANYIIDDTTIKEILLYII